jgi:hypothetical protein
MKKSKLLLLVLVAPLLTGCGKSVKAPKFAKEGESVSGEKFVEDFVKAYESCAFAKEDALGSLEIESSMAMSQEGKVTRGKTVIEEGGYYISSTGKAQYDAAKSIYSSVAKMTTEQSSKSVAGKSTIKDVEKQDESYEPAQVSGANYVVLVDNVAKEYEPAALLEGDATAAKWVDAKVKSDASKVVSMMAMAIEEYAVETDEEEKAKYKFFESGNIFTLTYSDKVENKEIKDGEDKVIRVENGSTEYKFQLDFTAGKLAYKYWMSSSEKVEYKAASSEYGVGDISESSIKYSGDTKLNNKDLKLKAASLDKYTKLGF